MTEAAIAERIESNLARIIRGKSENIRLLLLLFLTTKKARLALVDDVVFCAYFLSCVQSKKKSMQANL